MRRAVMLICCAALAALAPPAAAAQAPRTGRLLVLLRSPHGAHAAAAQAVAARAGARRAGFDVPQIGLVTVRPRPGESLRALVQRLRSDPRVASVQSEHRARLRYDPNDPALTDLETAAGTPPGTTVEWWAPRENLPAAWDISRGDGAVVAIIDSGIETSHPELTDQIAGTADFDPGDSGSATTDSLGHGTHVASLACGEGDNGVGLAGAGLHCKILDIRSDLTDSSVAASIVYATDHGADAINMSFGTDGSTPPSQAVVSAIDYAYQHGVVMVAAAADNPTQEQGYPSDVLQPSGTGPQVGSGKGLSVTAADFDDRRASFAGFGTQISLAAYGAFRGTGAGGPPGIFGAFTQNLNDLETGSLIPPRPPCGCRADFHGDRRYGYLQGTSMAAPMVTAVAALMRHLNPPLGAVGVIRAIEETARQPAGSGWQPDLGWGILDAGRALQLAAQLDRTAPVSRLLRAPSSTHAHTIRLRWRGTDAGPPGV
ncbi:MAG TPA: S8 family serine peptidase, partial [Solirubrobacteraceae bacterium]|nr:S8 family serine peptidase [Solirubrobacteraceae bacterium]